MSERGTVALMPTCLVDLVRPEAGRRRRARAAARRLPRDVPGGPDVLRPAGLELRASPTTPVASRRRRSTRWPPARGRSSCSPGSCAATMLHAWPELFAGRRRASRACWSASSSSARCSRRSRARRPASAPAGAVGLPLLLPPAARPARHDLGPGADRRRCRASSSSSRPTPTPAAASAGRSRSSSPDVSTAMGRDKVRPRARRRRRRARLGRRGLPHAPRRRGRRATDVPIVDDDAARAARARGLVAVSLVYGDDSGARRSASTRRSATRA